MKKLKINRLVFFFFLSLFLELTYRFLIYDKFFSEGLLFIILFTIPSIFLLNLFTSVFSERVNKFLIWSFTFLFYFFYVGQFVFTKFFAIPFSFSTLNTALSAITFVDIIVNAILKNILGVLIFTIPLILLIIFRKKIDYSRYQFNEHIILFIFFVTTLVLAIFSLNFGKSNLYSSSSLYYNVNAPKLTIEKFGLMTYTRLDIKRVIFGFEETILEEKKIEEEIIENSEIKYNITDINFSELIQTTSDVTLTQMHEYFQNSTVTKQNEYTGMFSGKNLIFIMAEGFNSIAVSEELTPTLFKLTNESFVFNNFYSPVFLSTTGGEFQATTGLIPSQESLETWKNKQTYLPYAIGNTFGSLGYKTRSYHDWNYRYYQRQKTMPTLGFDDYLGCGNGLEKLMNCNQWTPSDIDMIDATTGLFLGKETPFLTYYFTVSGHSNYNFGGQRIASKNKSLVDNLPYSDETKAYLATQLELEKALTLLLTRLEESGELSNTVIAMVADHYPYSLSLDAINELSSYSRDLTFEVNHSNFVLWTPGLDRIEIDKVGSQIDILPTILNLFGINYDSRLIIGKDILSDTEGLAIFSDRSFITDLGKYSEQINIFTPKEGIEVTEDYVDNMKIIVANKFTMSNLIVSKDYYRHVIK